MPHFFKSEPSAAQVKKAAQAAGYGMAAAATGTVALAGSAVVVASVPAVALVGAGLVTGALGVGMTYPAAFATRFFAHKASHKGHRACGDESHHDKSHDMKFMKPKTW